MAFDHVVPGQAPHDLAPRGDGADAPVAGALQGEARRSWRSAMAGPPGALADRAGRNPRGPSRRSADGTLERGPWTGIAIGGLSVGEPKPVMHRVLEDLGPVLPPKCPVILWVSDFPRICCRASRAASTCSTAWPPRGMVATAPPGCRRAGSTCGAPRSRARSSRSIPSATARPAPRIPRGYLRHLFVVEDMLGLRLVSLHNVRFLVRLGEQARARNPGRDVRRLEPRMAPPPLRSRRHEEHSCSRARPGSGGGLTILVLQMAAIGLVFYFLILRPSGQARKKHAELLSQPQEGRRGDDRAAASSAG